VNIGVKLLVLISLIMYYLNPFAQSITELSPEPSSEFTNKKIVFGRQQMVVSANPYISEASNMILAQGGNAADAAIAAALMVTLVEPQSGGIGGGGFILYFNPKESILTSIDARETSSNTTQENQFLDNSNNPLRYSEAVYLGTSVGVPSLLKGLALFHKKYGTLEWKKLFLSEGANAVHVWEGGYGEYNGAWIFVVEFESAEAFGASMDKVQANPKSFDDAMEVWQKTPTLKFRGGGLIHYVDSI
jgi:hypothetical protein